MATKSFLRTIEITEPIAVKKIHFAMKSNNINNFKTSIRDIDSLKKCSRESLSDKLTKKY
ncbi:MAG: hypothetical protein N4A54_11285 [Peptostreptococcaceae bacterium]|jgi:Holliday junction resolvase RusA-like endonuclease|nr:hypothetical protein [Peptostreptococcaceae bacterium]